MAAEVRTTEEPASVNTAGKQGMDTDEGITAGRMIACRENAESGQVGTFAAPRGMVNGKQEG